MRRFGVVRPFDGGGGGAVAGLRELIASTPINSWSAVESWAAFIALPGVTEGPAGVWNFDEPIYCGGTIVVDVGARVVGGENSAIFSIQSLGAAWVFDVDGPGISGPLRIQGLTIVQLNAGANAIGLSVSTSLGRVAIVIECLLNGGRIGIEIINCASPVALDVIGISQCDRGVVLRGTIAETVIQIVTPFNMTLTDSVGFEAEASVIMGSTSTMIFIGCAAELASDQSSFAFAHAMSLANPALVQVAGGGVAGPQGQVLRQTAPGVTDMDVDDDRLVIAGNTSQADWHATLIASRSDAADPLVVTVSGALADNLIPYIDAAQNLSLVASTENHMTLVLGAAVPGTDWHIQYTGPLTGVTLRLGVEGLAKRASGAGPSLTLVKWQKDAAPAYAGFVDIPDTSVPWSSSNAYVPFTGQSIAVAVNTDDRFRPVLVNQTDAGDIQFGALQTILEVSK